MTFLQRLLPSWFTRSEPNRFAQMRRVWQDSRPPIYRNLLVVRSPVKVLKMPERRPS
jgi:hypothetical protein